MSKPIAKKMSPGAVPAKGGHRLPAEHDPGWQAMIDAVKRNIDNLPTDGKTKAREALVLLMAAVSHNKQAKSLRDGGVELLEAEQNKAARQPELTKPSTEPQRYNIGPAARFMHVYQAAPQEKIAVIKQGLSAEHVGALAEVMAISKETLINTLRLSRATVNRKARGAKALSQDETERVLGVESLIGQVETMVTESGDPTDFDAAKWTSAWLNSPLPALDNETPASYMDTIEGQKMVSNLLATAQTGAYA